MWVDSILFGSVHTCVHTAYIEREERSESESGGERLARRAHLSLAGVCALVVVIVYTSYNKEVPPSEPREGGRGVGTTSTGRGEKTGKGRNKTSDSDAARTAGGRGCRCGPGGYI